MGKFKNSNAHVHVAAFMEPTEELDNFIKITMLVHGRNPMKIRLQSLFPTQEQKSASKVKETVTCNSTSEEQIFDKKQKIQYVR